MDKDPWYFPRSAFAHSFLLELTLLNAHPRVILAEQRMGKTSLLLNDLIPVAGKFNFVPVYIDVWSVRDDPESGIADQMRIACEKLERNSKGSPGHDKLTEPKIANARIHYWVSRVADAVGSSRVLLMIDEVQALTTYRDGVTVASALRASIADHCGRFQVVFTGNNRDRLATLFRTSSSPFWRYGDEIILANLGIEFADHLVTQFREASGGVVLDKEQLTKTFEGLGSRPGDIVSLLRKMLREHEYDLTYATSKVLAEERATRDLEMNFGRLSRLDKAVMVALAHGSLPFGRQVMAFYSTVLCSRVAPSTVQRSLERLRTQRLIYQIGRGSYGIEDQALEKWILSGEPELIGLVPSTACAFVSHTSKRSPVTVPARPSSTIPTLRSRRAVPSEHRWEAPIEAFKSVDMAAQTRDPIVAHRLQAYRLKNSPQADGALHNRLLETLPKIDWARLRRHFSPIELPVGKILCEPNSCLDYAYFPTTAIVTLLHLAIDGTWTKIATIGYEGIVGITLILGGGTMTNHAVVQSTGQLYRLKSNILNEEFSHGGAMQHLLLRYTKALLTHIAQMAVCNRRHTIEQQLCGFVLLSLDRLTSQEMTMTHELLANTLGVRREGITEAAHKLQTAGIISYRRGHITVIDRSGLEARCCECYSVVRREYDRLPGPVDHTLHGRTAAATASSAESNVYRNGVNRSSQSQPSNPNRIA